MKTKLITLATPEGSRGPKAAPIRVIANKALTLVEIGKLNHNRISGPALYARLKRLVSDDQLLEVGRVSKGHGGGRGHPSQVYMALCLEA